MTTLYEGDAVSYVGTAMPPARGKLLFFASRDSAHVQWTEGIRTGEIDLIDIYDLAPITAGTALGETDPMGHTACVRALEAEGPAGVLNFLVASKQVSTWQQIAHDALRFVEARIRADDSMDMPNEQLSVDDYDRVVRLASRVLLHDAFGGLLEEVS